MANSNDMPSRTESKTRSGASARTHGAGAREVLLRALPLEERRRQLAGIPSSVLEGGAGPTSESPFVLLHGPGGHAAHWLRVIPALARRHRLVVPDLPGHGRTEPGDVELDARSVLAWLGDLLEQTCATPPVLVGELLGGAIALRFVMRHPRSVSQLVLVDSFGLAPFQPAPDFARGVAGVRCSARRTKPR